VIAHFGTTPLVKIEQDAIDKGARKVHLDAADATRVRQFYAPASAVLVYVAKRGWCARISVARLPRMSRLGESRLASDTDEHALSSFAVG
jgi:hypothetical protein